MNTIEVYGKDGKKKGEVSLPPALQEVKVVPSLVHQALVREQANARRGTAATKTKGLVSGGGIKPWRQKGTGRARSGSIRSPLWVGGGTIFGPQPRSYEKKMNRKMRQAAFRTIVADKINQGCFKVVEELHLKEAKTKGFLKLMKNLGINSSVLILTDKEDANLVLASRNLKQVKVLPVNNMNVYDLLKYQELVVTPDTLAVLGGEERAESI